MLDHEVLRSPVPPTCGPTRNHFTDSGSGALTSPRARCRECPRSARERSVLAVGGAQYRDHRRWPAVDRFTAIVLPDSGRVTR